MRRARLILLAVGALCVARSARAQWEASVDAGASYLRQTGLPESGSLLFGGTLDGATRRTYFRSSLLGAATSGNTLWSGTGQAVALAGIVDPSARRFRWELSGAASAFSQSETRPTTTGELAGGFQTGTPTLGASFGGGGGFSAHARDVIPVRRLSTTGWWGIATERFEGAIDLTHTRQQFFLAPSIPATYVDGTASWRHERRGIALDATVGYRGVTAGNVAKGAWVSGDAMFWVAQRTAIVVGAGRTPADVVRGFPLATYASVALRFTSRPHITLSRRAADGPRISATRTASDIVVLEVRASNERTVEIAADFTAWQPVALERVGDVWRLERVIPAGLHRLTFRIDGGEWRVPPNLPRVNDDLTGSAAIITIP
jgi:hypothetical protein